jgi:general secretion pathway protein K
MHKPPHESSIRAPRPRARSLPPLARRQRGVALLIAILLVALGTMVAAALAYNNAMTARRTIADFSYDQALLITEGVEAYSAYGLWLVHKNDPNVTYPGQGWDQPLNVSPSPGVNVQASLEDLQGRFNLNDLIESKGNGVTPNLTALAVFQRLLEMVGLQPVWAEDVVNWIDTSPTPLFPQAASDTQYLEMAPPYYAPNRPITSTSELLALPGFGRERFEKIAPYITALPVGTALNICSASPVVLDAFLGHREYSVDPKRFASDRQAAGGCFPSMQEFQTAFSNMLPGGTLGGSSPTWAQIEPLIGDESSYFRLSTFVRAGTTEFAFYSLLYQDDGEDGKVLTVLRSDTPN